jgi:hypothetical protein
MQAVKKEFQYGPDVLHSEHKNSNLVTNDVLTRVIHFICIINCDSLAYEARRPSQKNEARR